jgi:hypothetical protein
MISVPGGFGEWFLHFPETMLLEGPPQGKAKMTRTVLHDGTIVLAGRMEGRFAHAIGITYKPGKDCIDLGLTVTNLSKEAWRYGGEAMACLRLGSGPPRVNELHLLMHALEPARRPPGTGGELPPHRPHLLFQEQRGGVLETLRQGLPQVVVPSCRV